MPARCVGVAGGGGEVRQRDEVALAGAAEVGAPADAGEARSGAAAVGPLEQQREGAVDLRRQLELPQRGGDERRGGDFLGAGAGAVLGDDPRRGLGAALGVGTPVRLRLHRRGGEVAEAAVALEERLGREPLGGGAAAGRLRALAPGADQHAAVGAGEDLHVAEREGVAGRAGGVDLVVQVGAGGARGQHRGDRPTIGLVGSGEHDAVEVVALAAGIGQRRGRGAEDHRLEAVPAMASASPRPVIDCGRRAHSCSSRKSISGSSPLRTKSTQSERPLLGSRYWRTSRSSCTRTSGPELLCGDDPVGGRGAPVVAERPEDRAAGSRLDEHLVAVGDEVDRVGPVAQDRELAGRVVEVAGGQLLEPLTRGSPRAAARSPPASTSSPSITTP